MWTPVTPLRCHSLPLSEQVPRERRLGVLESITRNIAPSVSLVLETVNIEFVAPVWPSAPGKWFMTAVDSVARDPTQTISLVLQTPGIEFAPPSRTEACRRCLRWKRLGPESAKGKVSLGKSFTGRDRNPRKWQLGGRVGGRGGGIVALPNATLSPPE